MKFFPYGKKEIEYLKKRDKVLGLEIDRIGMLERQINENVFESLISSIISQQISISAAQTVEKRLLELAGRLDSTSILELSKDQIQKCGMSMRKAEYIYGIALAAEKKEIKFDDLDKYEDKEIIEILTSLRGVGEWTAEMLLIHSFLRPDILSYKDLGIRRGITRLYGIENLDKKDFEVFRERYSPYGSIASLYLWEISGQ